MFTAESLSSKEILHIMPKAVKIFSPTDQNQ